MNELLENHIKFRHSIGELEWTAPFYKMKQGFLMNNEVIEMLEYFKILFIGG